jgi:hypothetical protein
MLLVGIDGRSRPARRYRDLYRSYLRKTGGKHDELCKQLASLVLQRELHDSAMVRGERVDTDHMVRVINAINRTMKRLNFMTGEHAANRRRRLREEREAGLIA